MAQAKMLSKKSSTLKGFTIIEVVLVLAIAGLIFLMVFIALPALQRNQRDTQRRQDYSNLSSAVTSYTTNNNGKLPSSMNATDLNANGQDPQGYDYDIKVVDAGTTCTPGLNNNKMIVCVVRKASCGSDGITPTAKTGANRAFVVYGYTEGGGGKYCLASGS